MAQQEKGVVDWAARLRASLAPRHAAELPVEGVADQATGDAKGIATQAEPPVLPEQVPLAAPPLLLIPHPAPTPKAVLDTQAKAVLDTQAKAVSETPPEAVVERQAEAPPEKPVAAVAGKRPEAEMPPAGLLSFLSTAAPVQPATPLWSSPLLAALGVRDVGPTATETGPEMAPPDLPKPAPPAAKPDTETPATTQAFETPHIATPRDAGPTLAILRPGAAATATPESILSSRPVLKASRPAPAIESPAIESPAFEPPATEPPATEPSAIEPQATEPPPIQAGEAPAAEAPVPDAPAAEPPVTETSVTGVPATKPATAAMTAEEAPPDAPSRPAAPPAEKPVAPKAKAAAPVAEDPLGAAHVAAAYQAVFGTALPAEAQDEGAEWVGLARSLEDARGSWRGLFLGVQHPSLPLAAAQACGRKGLTPVLHATESDPGRFGRLLTALQAEGLDGGETRLLQAAVGADPDKLPPRGALVQDLLAREESWDYLRVGVPRLLVGLTSRGLPALDARVRWLMLAPLNRGEENAAIRVLSASWRLVAERPAVLLLADPRTASRPGIQLWRGPLA